MEKLLAKHNSLSTASFEDERDGFRDEASDEKAVSLLCDLLDHGQDHFDPAVYLACSQYVDRHETEERMSLQLQSEEPMDSEQWAFLSYPERLTIAFEQPLRTGYGKALLVLQILVVLFSVIAVIMETMNEYNPSIHPSQLEQWDIIEGLVAFYLLIELSIRLACYPAPKRRFVLRKSNFLDLCSVVPFFVRLGTTSLPGFEILKVLRLVRVLKFLRYGKTFQQVVITMRKSIGSLVASFIFLSMILLVLSSALYHSERGFWNPLTNEFTISDCLCEATPEYELGLKHCPKKVSKFISILQAVWFVMTTITTVGYGDIVPVCPMGMSIAMSAMIFGTFILAMPIGIVGAYYALIVSQSNQTIRRVRSDMSRRMSSRRFSLGGGRNVEDVVKAEATYSPGEKLLNFLKSNVGSRSLEQVRFAEPSPDLLFYLNMYLLDFVEELSRMPDELLGAQKQIGILNPCFSSTKMKPYYISLDKSNEKFDIKLFEEEVSVFRSQLQELLPFVPKRSTDTSQTAALRAANERVKFEDLLQEWTYVAERLKMQEKEAQQQTKYLSSFDREEDPFPQQGPSLNEEGGPNLPAYAIPNSTGGSKMLYLNSVGQLVPRLPHGHIIRYFSRVAGIVMTKGSFNNTSHGDHRSQHNFLAGFRIADAVSLQTQVEAEGEEVLHPPGSQSSRVSGSATSSSMNRKSHATGHRARKGHGGNYHRKRGTSGPGSFMRNPFTDRLNHGTVSSSSSSDQKNSAEMLGHLLHSGRFKKSDEAERQLTEAYFSLEKSLYPGSSVEIFLPATPETRPDQKFAEVKDGSGDTSNGEVVGRKFTLRYMTDNSDLEEILRSFHCALEIEKAHFNPLLLNVTSGGVRKRVPFDGNINGTNSDFDQTRTHRSFYESGGTPGGRAVTSFGQRKQQSPLRGYRIGEDESSRLERLTSINPSSHHHHQHHSAVDVGQTPPANGGKKKTVRGGRISSKAKPSKGNGTSGTTKKGTSSLTRYNSQIPPGGHR